MSHKRYRLSLQHNSLQDLKKELKKRSHYRFREYWRPCNGVNEPEEMVTGAGRSQGTRAATESMPLGNSKDP